MTRYFVSYKPKNGPENFTHFGSALGRALFMISYPEAEILKQWEESKTELQFMGDDIDQMFEEVSAGHRRIVNETIKRCMES